MRDLWIIQRKKDSVMVEMNPINNLSKIRSRGRRPTEPKANRWIDWNSFNKMKKLKLRSFLTLEIPLIMFAVATIVLDLIDIAEFYHWIPEFITFFLLGRCYFRVGLSTLVILTAGLFILGCGGLYLVAYGILYSMPLVAGFSIVFYAGYRRGQCHVEG